MEIGSAEKGLFSSGKQIHASLKAVNEISQILYICHPFWGKLATADIHKNLFTDFVFRANPRRDNRTFVERKLNDIHLLYRHAF